MDEMAARRALAERVDSGDLSRDEQETWISFTAADDRLEIGSYVPTLVRKLLRHSEAAVEWCYVRPSEGRHSLERDITEILDAYPGGSIEGIQATMPVGALTVKGSPRQRDSPSKIINTPEEAREAREAFEEVEAE